MSGANGLKLKRVHSSTLLAVSIVMSHVSFAQTEQVPITFEQIYESPDDLDLSLAYAKQSVANGEYLQAMGVLEALLFANPDWDSARIFYAYVLFKLDDQRSVRRELAFLENRPLATPQKVRLDVFKREINTKPHLKPRPKLEGRLEIGARYDDNAGNTLSETVLSNPRQSDVSVLLNAVVGLKVPLSEAHNRALKLVGRYQTLKHETFDNGDYDVFRMSGGYSQDLLGGSIDLALDYNTVAIDGASYLEETGPRLRLTKALSEDTIINLSGVAYYQAYKDLPNAVGEVFRSGQNYTVGLGIKHRLKPNQVVRTSLSYNMKDAQAAALRYNGFNAGVNFSHTFRDATFLSGTASYRKLNFLNPVAGSVPPLKRDDDHIFLKAVYGVPLNVAAEKVGMTPKDSLEDLAFEVGLSFEDRRSNISGFNYDNFGTEIKLVWTF